MTAPTKHTKSSDYSSDVVKSVDAARRARADQAAVVPKARNEVTNEIQSTLYTSVN
jgi:hypothetical protein